MLWQVQIQHICIPCCTQGSDRFAFLLCYALTNDPALALSLELYHVGKNAALMHHERCDGSGYPFGLTGNRIDKFAKIVSIADVYDAMTAARVYRGPLCPFTVIDIFEKEGLQKYESEYILCFLKNVVLTYIGQRVRLTNGQEGDVVFINPQQLSRPMIKCGDTFVDLSKQKDIAIERLL